MMATWMKLCLDWWFGVAIWNGYMEWLDGMTM